MSHHHEQSNLKFKASRKVRNPSKGRTTAAFNVDSFKQTEDQEIFEKIEGIEDVLNVINNSGSNLWKVRSTSKWFRRKFDLNIRDMQINYSPSSKKGVCCTGDALPSIDIADISEVRRGWKTDIFNKIELKEEKRAKKRHDGRHEVDEACCFSIIYGERRNNTLDLVASSPEIAEKWVKAIEHLLSWYESKQLEAGYEIWLRRKFNAADVNNDKCLTFRETQNLLFELNIEVTEEEAAQLFSLANTDPRTVGQKKVEVLTEDEFMNLYFRLIQRSEIEALFKSFLSTKNAFTAVQLQQFLKNEQGGFENVTKQECDTLLQIYEYSDTKSKGHMTSAGFLNMLLSPEFDLFNYKEHKHVCQDMTQPLSHYFIASSHNTYMTGNQVSGKASVEAYIESLKRGCRCVEIDCWDGDDEEPIVWHGHTFVTKIPFREVLEDAIKPFAFTVSNYPLILSLEVHCSPAVRIKMTYYLKEILGDTLYSDQPVSSLEFLPSPKELQGKILVKAKTIFKDKIKVKKKFPNLSSMASDSRSDTFSTDATFTRKEFTSEGFKTTVSINYEETGMSNFPGKSTSIDQMSSRDIYPNFVESDDDSDDDETIDGREEVYNASRYDLPSLVNLCRATKFKSFEECRLIGKCYEMSSFSEPTALKFLKESPVEFINYNKRQLSRIYPSATRALSSNFMPVPFWRLGSQLVALNYQTNDVPNLINDAMFEQNGGCGYVLKPTFLRTPNTLTAAECFGNSCMLTLRIISGQHLPKAEENPEVVDPYVEFKVIGSGKEDNEFTTRKIQNNGFNPIWNESFEVRVKCPELAFIMFRVRDHAQSGTDVPLAYYAAPFSAIRTGYCHIRLKNISREHIPPSSLFVHVSIKKYSGS